MVGRLARGGSVVFGREGGSATAWRLARSARSAYGVRSRRWRSGKCSRCVAERVGLWEESASVACLPERPVPFPRWECEAFLLRGPFLSARHPSAPTGLGGAPLTRSRRAASHGQPQPREGRLGAEPHLVSEALFCAV